MALTLSTIWEIQTGGSDTANGGAFDPSQTAGMFTDGTGSSSSSATPTFHSASYTFVNNDVGAWVYIASGGTYIAGWYKITGISSGDAQLDAAIGHAVLKTSLIPNTVQGIGATTANATWTIDYSQGANSGAGPAYTFTHLSSTGAGLTVSGGGSGEHTFGKQDVGNCLVITGGTNFNTGRYVIASVAAGVATVIGPTNIHSAAGTNSDGAGALGGAMKSLGAVGVLVTINGMTVSQKAGTYSITSATTNIAAGCFAPTGFCYLFGYSSVRGDLGTPPLNQASGINTFTLINVPVDSQIVNMKVDGAASTSSRGFTISRGFFYKLAALNCTNNGINCSSTGTTLVNSYATGCSTQTAINQQGMTIGCEAYTNTVTGFTFANAGVMVDCLSYGNTGSTSDGFSGSAGLYVNCSAYGNGRSGFRTTGSGLFCVNCISESNAVSATGYGYDFGSQTDWALLNCSSFGSTARTNTTTTNTAVTKDLNGVSSGSSVFVNAASGNFALNNTASAGRSLRAAGYPGTFLSGTTVGYLDIGAVQHADPASGIPPFIAGVIG